MTLPIRPAGAPLHAPTAPAAPPSDLQRVAKEFESMLVRQLLNAAKLGEGGGGYADMAVTSLADGINQAGGVGLARQIERALARQIDVGEPPAPLSHSRPAVGGRSSE